MKTYPTLRQRGIGLRFCIFLPYYNAICLFCFLFYHCSVMLYSHKKVCISYVRYTVESFYFECSISMQWVQQAILGTQRQQAPATVSGQAVNGTCIKVYAKFSRSEILHILQEIHPSTLPVTLRTYIAIKICHLFQCTHVHADIWSTKISNQLFLRDISLMFHISVKH